MSRTMLSAFMLAVGVLLGSFCFVEDPLVILAAMLLFWLTYRLDMRLWGEYSLRMLAEHQEQARLLALVDFGYCEPPVARERREGETLF